MDVSLKNIELSESREFRTGTDFEPVSFFIDGLLNSKQFDLLLGFFSSSSINLLSLGFAQFISNGGKMRLIINQFLSPIDKDVIINGITKPISYFDKYQLTLENLSKELSKYDEHFFKCVSYLISQKRIDIIIISPLGGKGISHYKSGIFSDGQNIIKFKGSCNFTASGLLENLEELEIKCSWENKINYESIKEYQEYYDNIFFKRADFVRYLDIDKIQEIIVDRFGDVTLDSLIEHEKDLLNNYKTNLKYSIHLKRQLDLLNEQLLKYKKEPRFPYGSEPRDYQGEAYNNWVKSDCKGIFAMATGTGKTITSLNCLLEEFRKVGIYQAIILVPTNVLVDQWEVEAEKFNFQNIIKVSSRFQWREKLGRLRTQLSYGSGINFIIITTYASFILPRFQTYFKRLPSTVMLIADEAHNMASPKLKDILPDIHLSKRLALSATPSRKYDIDGNIVLESFFNSSKPYTYNFSMKRAIDEGILSKYYYYPIIVTLTEDELEKYIEITKKLIQYFDSKTGKYKEDSIVEILLMQRKRVIHKASNKLKVFRSVIGKLKEETKLKYLFVYAPEGFEDLTWESIGDEEEVRLISRYVQVLNEESPNTKSLSFIGDTKDKNVHLKQFEDGNIDILLSMKCLDEGVDLPRAETAIFCSSTGNPRQFIQRRGRILRKHPEKHMATIYDMVVIPKFSSFSNSQEHFKLEKNLIKSELERVIHFASMSENSYEAYNVFDDVCKYYGINIHALEESLNN